MTKVRFYFFETRQERQVESACRLCRKILATSQRIWLYVPDPVQQQLLDQQLWNFEAHSFIPHGINDSNAPVCISAELPQQSGWICINLSQQSINNVQLFSQIVEIVENNEAAKIVGREKFIYYRNLGLELKTYKL